MSNDFAKDYIDVAARIAAIRGAADKQYPDGSFQPWEPWRLVEVDGQTFLAYTAAFYRTPDDPRPGVGAAWEPVPGRTPYTKGSELQNAETSAWGRALVAALAADTKKGIASLDEVRNRQAEHDLPDDGFRAGTTRRAKVREPERVTDTEWLEDFRQRLNWCTRPTELRGLQEEANVVWAENRLSQDDAKALKAEVTARLAELTAPVVEEVPL